MFSIQHIIWLIISITLIVVSMICLIRKHPSLLEVLRVCTAVCIASELVKVLSCIEIVPSSDGSLLFPYLENQHLPLHLCSIQLLLIFYCTFSKQAISDSPRKQAILAFMYPTCVIGAAFALALPSIFQTTISVEQAFTHPVAYQTFIYHSMLIVLGLYIPISGEVAFSRRTYRQTMLLLGAVFFCSFYVNSVLASPTYENGNLVSVDYVTNFFFSYRTPIGITLTQKWHWFLYTGILIALAFALIALFYVPLKRNRQAD